MNYERAIKYFLDSKIAIIMGVILLVVALGLFAAEYTIGGLIAIVIAILCFIAASKTVKDEEIDAMLASEMEKLEHNALNKLGLEKDEISYADPIKFCGWNYSDSTGSRNISDKTIDDLDDKCGKDEKWRSPVAELHFFAFSENTVHYYCKYISLVSDTNREKTEEYFYKDIVSVRTDTKVISRWDSSKKEVDSSKKIKINTFDITTSGGVGIACSVYDSNIAESAVNAMRSLLKQKKMQQ